jgi:anhydro-N-acetylmuramic acid kinase
MKYAEDADEVLVCGGGTKNGFLMKQLTDMLPRRNVWPTDRFGLKPDWVEAAAFAWLAQQFLCGEPGNMPSVTGAARPAVLGSLFTGTD